MPIRKNLTELFLEKKLEPPTDRQFVNYHDGILPGLVLRVSAKGRKTWVAHYPAETVNKHGKRITITTSKALGLYPMLKVKEAREKARPFLADPKKAKAQADTGTFREVAENFIKRYVDEKQLRTRKDIVRLLNTHIYPHWQHRVFREIKRADVADLLDKIVDQHGSRQADICLAIIRKCMNWFATRDSDYSSPIVTGMGRHSGHKRDRILTDDEIRALWQACDGTFGALVKVLLLTGQRRDKVITMQWEDVEDGVWTIPSAAREKTNAGSLRLPPAVLDVINAQPRIVGNPFVFAGRGTVPFNAVSDRKREVEKKLGKVPHWTLHDLRRTARSLMARAGVRPDIAERVLGHTIKGVEGVYDRHSYSDEKADALMRLAALINTIVNPPPANVVALNEAAPKRTRKRV
jgi:integrase